MAKDLGLGGSETHQWHERILAALFCFYGFSHLAVASFFWVIILALAKESYYQFQVLRTFGGFGMTLVVVAMPLLSAYALLRRRRWAKGVTGVTCLGILIFSFVLLSRLVSTGPSATRVLFGSLYGAASLAICIYGLWFVLVRPSSLRAR
jgi:hypothetical protein